MTGAAKRLVPGRFRRDAGATPPPAGDTAPADTTSAGLGDEPA